MFRRRLRPMPTPEELAQMYVKPHDARLYGYGHGLRVEHSIALGTWLAHEVRASSVGDLSCGNADIPQGIAAAAGVCSTGVRLGDFASGYEFIGPIEETIHGMPPVDLFILSETIEHLDDPERILREVHVKARALLLSTPIGEDDLGNPEHLWGWDQEVVEEMLRSTGWTPRARVDLVLPDTYSYQIHAAVR